MMRENYRRTGGRRGRTVAAFALGATLGSVTALLFAPASGEVTRKRLIMKAKTARRAVGRKLQRAQRVLADRAVLAREAATDWISEHIPNGHGRRPARRRVLRHA